MTLPHFSVVTVTVLLVLAGCASGGSENKEAPAPQQVLRVSGSGTALPPVEKLAEVYGVEHPETELQFEPGTNSGGAIKGVLDGTLDLAVANRPLSEEEEGEPIVYTPFAKDAVAFVANGSGEVEGLSTDQVRDVYGGGLTNWEQLGGSAADIVVLDRDEVELARKLVLVPLMNGRPVEARTVVLNKAGEMIEAMKSTPNSLGYSSLGLLSGEDNPELRILALDGVMPSPEAVLGASTHGIWASA